ncbi:MAG: chorismate mutase [Polyangiaceae bacterium]
MTPNGSHAAPSPELESLRARIGEIDAQILTLALARTEVIGKIAAEKERLSLPVRDDERERAHVAVLLDEARGRGAGNREASFVREVFEGIFEASRRLQSRQR